MASEAFEKWWNRETTGRRVGGWQNPRDHKDLSGETWGAAVEACAAEVEREGCQCGRLTGAMVEVPVGMEFHNGRMMHRSDGHYEACPRALAARLRRLA